MTLPWQFVLSPIFLCCKVTTIVGDRKIVVRPGDSVRVEWKDDKDCYCDVDAIVAVKVCMHVKVYYVCMKRWGVCIYVYVCVYVHVCDVGGRRMETLRAAGVV